LAEAARPARIAGLATPRHVPSQRSALLQRAYHPGMSGRRERLEVEVDPRLHAYAEHLVEAGQAASVSDVINDALAEREQRDREALDHVRETAARADPARLARILAHIDRQATALPAT
jgi:Arc/MetJ-type ribon-helix-helix transcriptional regulator